MKTKIIQKKTEPLSRLIQRRIEGRADSERKSFWHFFRS
ncbi:protease La [Haemophilus influenzae]|uniref:Protease La n=1 Tax=Haemophilus influenzae TaxID=727 RepID=A0A2X1QSN0_HAEIF|nr:protease La [Haemophilus influenzae]